MSETSDPEGSSGDLLDFYHRLARPDVTDEQQNCAIFAGDENSIAAD